MFKNLIVYRIAPGWQADLTQLEEALAKTPFQECGATQEKAVGWVPPRGDAHGPLAESVGGQWMLRFMAESKMLPATVLARKVKEKMDDEERRAIAEADALSLAADQADQADAASTNEAAE